MPLQIIARPTAEPIDLILAQLQTKQDAGIDDVILRACIAGAREFAQSTTNRQIIAARYKLVLDSFPSGSGVANVPYGETFSLPANAILLEPNPVIQVVSIQYLAMDNTLQLMPATDYVADLTSEPARITPVFGKIWPIPLPQIGSVIVTFDAGYAAPAVFDAAADTMTLGGWKALAVNDSSRLTNSGGVLPTPLSANLDYYVQTVVAPGVYKLSLTAGGAAIDITTVGTGTHYLGEVPEGFISWMMLRLGSLYQNREEVALLSRGKLEPLPFVDGLLDQYRVWRI